MQSQDVDEIQAALYEQAFHGWSKVSCPAGQVMAIRKRKGQLRALIRGLGRWYDVPAVTIERPPRCPTGACDLEDATE